MSLLIPNHHPINPDDLVLWLDYKNTGSVAATGTWKDYSGNGTDGTLVADAYVDNGGLNLDGTGDLLNLTTHYANLEGWNAGTFLAWIKTTATGYIYSVSDGSDSTNFMYIVGMTSTNILNFLIRRGGTRHLGMTVNSPGIFDGAWHHIAVKTGDGANGIYIDGQAASVNFDYGSISTNEFSDIDTPSHAAVGSLRYNNVWQAPFNGQIAGVQVFNRALSVGEIQAHYMRTLRA